MTRAKAALHDLVDLGEHNWADPNYKPLLNPSRVATFKFCSRLYRWVYVKRLDAPFGPSVPMIQGSLYHEMSRAIDAGDDVHAALERAATDMRLSPLYNVKLSGTIDYLLHEMERIWAPKYEKFIATGGHQARSQTISLETPHKVEFDTFKLITIPDKVVRSLDDGSVWIVERKTTAQDSSQWWNKWPLNAQTTAEAMAVEKALDEPVSGVYIEPVVVTRKRSSKWTADYPQPIHSFTHYPWRPVAKSPWLKDEWLKYMEGTVEEMKWRDLNGREWDPNYTNCATCRMSHFCSGRIDPHDPQDGLVALNPDYVMQEVAQERIAAGLSPTQLLQLAGSGALVAPATPDPDTKSGIS